VIAPVLGVHLHPLPIVVVVGIAFAFALLLVELVNFLMVRVARAMLAIMTAAVDDDREGDAQ
jgi:hypothetical protein